VVNVIYLTGGKRVMDNEFGLDLSSFPKELNVMLAIMSMEEGSIIPESIKELAADIDWNEFLQLVKHHRVYPTIYSKLKNLNDDLVPNNVLQALRSEFTINTFKMLHLSGEMEQVCKIFHDNKIRSMMLKGPVLAEALYGDLSLRTSKDLDILVPVDDVEKTIKILLELGYVKEGNFPRVLNDWKWKIHHLAFLHAEKRIQIELHWRLNPGMGNQPNFNELWERRRVSSLTSEPVYLLGNEDLFLYLVSHGARHGWSRLRWLADIDRMVRKSLDWGDITFKMKKFHCLPMGGQALILASQLLNTPLNDETKKWTSSNHAFRIVHLSIRFIKDMVILHPPTPDLVDYYNRYKFSLKSNRYKWIFIISRLYPTSFDAVTLPLPKILHFLYFPLRPFLWYWRKTKRQSSL
jgi:hypothetical protein